MDLLGKYTSAKLPLTTFLEILTPMRVRQYSISSSTSYLGERKYSLTVAVLIAPAKSGLGLYKGRLTLLGEADILGVASNYLATLEPGAKVLASTRPSSFKLLDNLETPIIMVDSGTGTIPLNVITYRKGSRHSRVL